MIINEVEEIIDTVYGQFGIFYQSYLYQVYEKLDSFFQGEIEKIIKDKKTLIINILSDMLSELMELCSKVLIAEFYSYKEKSNCSTDTNYELYEQYCDKLATEQGRCAILRKYPVLKNLLKVYLEQRVNYLEESVINFRNDKFDIIKEFGFSDDILIEKIEVTSGDTHNHGRKVICFVLSEARIVYKPRSLETEHIFYKILDYISPDIKQCYLKDVSRKNHSWQEFAQYSEAETSEEVKVYYYKAGAMIFALDMMNSHDMHRENVIASQNGPICLDMETLIDSGQKELEVGDPPLKYINMECINSVLGTLILPTNCLHMIFDFDISAISGRSRYDSEKWYDFIFIDSGKDTIHLEKTHNLGYDNENLNILKYKGEIMNPQDYSDVLLEGYENAYRNFVVNRDKIIDLLSKCKVYIRQVLRPTAVYGRFLQASLYCEYLRDRKKYFELFEMFRSKTYDGKNEYEILDLINRDVPYFYSAMNENTLYSCQGVINNYFDRSVLTVLLNKILTINDEYIEKQKYYIRLALSTLDNYNGINHRLFLFTDGMSRQQMIGVIARRIENRMFWNVEETESYFLTTTVIHNKRSISMLNYNIYDGGGVILFFAALYYTTKEERYLKIVKGLYNACCSTKAIDGFDELGVFVGKMSYVYMYYFLYKYLGFDECKTLVENICVEVFNKLDESYKEYDIISGLAGIVVLSSNIAREGKIDNIPRVLKKASELIYHKCEEIVIGASEIKTGFAHGLSGIALALYKAYEYFGDDKYYKMAQKCINLEDKFYDEESFNWLDHRDNQSTFSYWCYGSAGIALSRFLMGQDISKAIKSILVKNMDSQCLCHGQMGNISILQVIQGNDDKLKNMRLKIMSNMKKQGILFGCKNLLEDYSFMQGLSGIGYELIRWENKHLPNILALEI